jgi:hypothetical protein
MSLDGCRVSISGVPFFNHGNLFCCCLHTSYPMNVGSVPVDIHELLDTCLFFPELILLEESLRKD